MTLKRIVLAVAVSERCLLPAKESARLVDLVFEAMAETLTRREKVKIQGFGTFSVRAKNARLGRNPKTGWRIEIAPRRVVAFKPSPALRKAVNQGEGLVGGEGDILAQVE